MERGDPGDSLSHIFDSELGELSSGPVSGRKYLLAVSGGRDSMCMADLFLHSRLHPEFAIATVNFSLRGEDSERDLSLVTEWAIRHSITCHTVRFDTRAYAREHSLSIEMAARELRYTWFYSLMDRYGYDLLAIAHNLNDSVETMFLNLVRGTGIDGMTGIRKSAGRIIRPLLEVGRQEIDAYVSARRVPYRDDLTNFGSDYSRNKIRNLVFPVLKSINPSYLDTIASDMRHFRQAAEILEEESGRVRDSVLRSTGGISTIDIGRLLAAGHPGYHLHRILSGFGFNPAQSDDIAEAIAPKTADAPPTGEPPGAKVLPKADIYRHGGTGRRFRSAGWELLIDRDVLIIHPSGGTPPEPVTIHGPGSYTFGDHALNLELRTLPEGFDPHPPRGTLYLCADSLRFPLTCRVWHPGDRFRPFGMKGTRLLSDFLTDLKMDRRAKSLQMVLCDASGAIVCLPGLRTDDRMRLDRNTRTLAVVTVYKI